MNLSTPAAVLDAYSAAVHDRSVEAFQRLYAAEARIFDTWGVWAYDGVASRQSSIEGWFASLGDERVKVTFDAVQVTEDQTLALLTATGRYAAVSADGAELRSMQNRFTWALQRRDGHWSILHEHTSTPIGFSDLKGILQRDGA